MRLDLPHRFLQLPRRDPQSDQHSPFIALFIFLVISFFSHLAYSVSPSLSSSTVSPPLAFAVAHSAFIASNL